MTTEEQMRASMQSYLDGFNSHDENAITSLFADGARVEDPVGGLTLEGRAAIEDFYRRGVEVVDRLELAAPIRSSHGSAAAMAFDIHMHGEGRPQVIRAIDVMTFDDTGKIIDMKAYHGPGDVEVGDQE